MNVLRDVRNAYTLDRGDLLVSSYRYNDGKETTNRGLVVYFRPEDSEDIHYVKSFILTPEEVNVIVNHQGNIAKDLGFILHFSNQCLEIMCIGGSTYSESKHFEGIDYVVTKMERHTYELDVDTYLWSHSESKLVKEYHANNKRCGMAKVIVDALKNPNLVEDCLVPTLRDLGDEIELVEYNYSK